MRFAPLIEEGILQMNSGLQRFDSSRTALCSQEFGFTTNRSLNSFVNTLLYQGREAHGERSVAQCSELSLDLPYRSYLLFFKLCVFAALR